MNKKHNKRSIVCCERRMGDLLRDTDTSSTRSLGGKFKGSEKKLPQGITHKQSHYYQAMADNKDIVEQVKKDAESNRSFSHGHPSAFKGHSRKTSK